MLRLYYIIWVDLITKAIARKGGPKADWKCVSIITMSIAMSLNFLLAMKILQEYVLKHYFYTIDFPFLHSRLSGIFSFTILFMIPMMIINYLLIFKDRRYVKLLGRFRHYEGKAFAFYFVFSIFVPVLLFWIAFFFKKEILDGQAF